MKPLQASSRWAESARMLNLPETFGWRVLSGHQPLRARNDFSEIQGDGK
jgi:hypothetical protein